MKNSIKLTSINLFVNFIFFIFMILCIQNSNNKRNIEFLSFSTIPLPISFIVGSSFILGSLNGILVVNCLNRKNKN